MAWDVFLKRLCIVLVYTLKFVVAIYIRDQLAIDCESSNSRVFKVMFILEVAKS